MVTFILGIKEDIVSYQQYWIIYTTCACTNFFSFLFAQNKQNLYITKDPQLEQKLNHFQKAVFYLSS